MKLFNKTFLVLSLTALLAACDEDSKDTAKSPAIPSVKPVPFNPVEATISDLHTSIQTKGASCVDVVNSYLDRIKAYDIQGPTLNSVIAINPNALKEAEELDKKFKETSSLTGPLHCVTVLAKDNIDVANMPNTAGSPELLDNIPKDDAYIIKNIKEKGGIILG